MKFIHLSDLHIGKRLHNVSLIEDQRYILERVLTIINETRPDALIISGDIYDVAVPPVEAVTLLDDFLTRLSVKGVYVFIISGNHDSIERLTFLSKILQEKNIYIRTSIADKISKITMDDEFGEANIYLLPFIKPIHVKAVFEDFDGDTYEEAVKFVIEKFGVDKNVRNIVSAHQFVTAQGSEPEISESERISVGGIDNINYQIFDMFDYVALGHLHAPQKSGRDTVMYSGSPLKYSLSEQNQKKCVLLVELKEKGNITIDKIPLIPLRDVREVKGTLVDILKMEKSDDYIYAVLVGNERYHEPFRTIKTVFENCLSVRYEQEAQSFVEGEGLSASSVTLKTHAEIFGEFYEIQNGEPLDENALQYIKELFEEEAENEA